MTYPELSIVIVSFNTRRMTLRCLESLFNDTNGLEIEVVVLDNDSSDGSADAIEQSFKQVKCIRSPNNVGFGPGNNKAAKAASGKHILLLNPDTIVKNNAVAILYNFSYVDGWEKTSDSIFEMMNLIFGQSVYFVNESLAYYGVVRPPVNYYPSPDPFINELGEYLASIFSVFGMSFVLSTFTRFIAMLFVMKKSGLDHHFSQTFHFRHFALKYSSSKLL